MKSVSGEFISSVLDLLTVANKKSLIPRYLVTSLRTVFMYLFKFFSSLDNNPPSKGGKKKISRLQGGLSSSFTHHLLFYGKTEITGSFCQRLMKEVNMETQMLSEGHEQNAWV